MVSIRKPEHWDEVVALAKLPPGTGNAEKRIAARPSLELSQDATDALLRNIRFESCQINQGYSEALGLKVTSETTG